MLKGLGQIQINHTTSYNIAVYRHYRTILRVVPRESRPSPLYQLVKQYSYTDTVSGNLRIVSRLMTCVRYREGIVTSASLRHKAPNVAHLTARELLRPVHRSRNLNCRETPAPSTGFTSQEIYVLCGI